MPDLDSEALDFRAASESFAPLRPIRNRNRKFLRLLTDYQSRKVPTVEGLLLFGRERTQSSLRTSAMSFQDRPVR